MRLDDLPESGNIEDRRSDGGGGGGGMGGFPIPMGGGGLGIGTVVVLGLIGWALGVDPIMLIRGAEQINRQSAPNSGPMRPGPGPQTQPGQRQTGSPQDEMGRFVNRVLGSTDQTWRQIFSQAGGRPYRTPTVILYNQVTRSSCGGAAQAAMGPFYCPVDQKVYLDTSFFRQLATRFGGCDLGSKGCQFAQAYVIAHEIGHHVQNQLGILGRAQQLQQAAGGKAEANQIQVRVELQADCLAGVWANFENQRLAKEGKPPFIETGDIEAALRTAAAIGDDTLQKRSRGYSVPDSFTHGSSAQRQRWFENGYKGGTIESCNTFSAAQI
jgi:predicted metalloprotease